MLETPFKKKKAKCSDSSKQTNIQTTMELDNDNIKHREGEERRRETNKAGLPYL